MLPYRLLADVESKLCDALGVIVDENLYGKNAIQRSTFLFDPNGTLVHVWPRARTRTVLRELVDRRTPRELRGLCG
jgi:peroxiredoxin Q/BCP